MTAIERHELTAWLGPAAGDLDAGQLDRLAGEADAIAARWPGRDDADRRDAALVAALEWVTGTADIDAAGRALAQVRLAEQCASAASQQLALMADADGMPEAEAARRAGIDRQWLRKLKGLR